jgi:hypothetical protein
LDGLSRKNFLGHLKKNIVQRNVAEKKILASNWGMKTNSCTEKLPNPPPQISNGPFLIKNLLDLSRSHDQRLPGYFLPKRKDPAYEVAYSVDHAQNSLLWFSAWLLSSKPPSRLLSTTI